jgi:hypothetical protein
MRFGAIIMAYFVIGAVLWGGGVIAWSQAGVAGTFIDDPENAETNEKTGQQLERLGGPIDQLADTVTGGGMLAVWNILLNLISFLFWPIMTLWRVGAPAEATVLLGGSLTTGFYVSLIRMVRGSA